jgi:hypothetical protein
MYGPQIAEREQMLNDEPMATLGDLYGQEQEQESDSVSEAVRDAQRNIADLWRQSADNALGIGYWLNTLHQWMDAEKFSAYTRDDLANLGISRSSAYRWMVLGKNLQRIFPNSALCDALVRLGDGRGIFAPFRPQNKDKHKDKDKVASAPAANDLEGAAQNNNAENRKADLSQMPLTAAALEALAGLPAPPSGREGDKETDDWARSFIKAVNQARAQQRAEKCAALKTAATQGESLLKRLEDFAADFGAEAFENFRERMDRTFGPRNSGTKAERQATSAGVPSNVGTQSQLKTEPEAGTPSARASQSQLETEPASAGAKAIPPVAQSQLGTGNLPPAVQAKTSAPVAAPNAVNQPSKNKDHVQGGVASAPASPIVVETTKPPQSQVGTGTANPSPAQAQAVPGAAPDTLVYQHNVHQNNVYQNNVHQNLVHPNEEQTRSGVPSVPAPQNAVPAANPAQSQVGTGPSSQHEDAKVGRTIYSDEARRSPYAIDFDFRLPGCRR